MTDFDADDEALSNDFDELNKQRTIAKREAIKKEEKMMEDWNQALEEEELKELDNLSEDEKLLDEGSQNEESQPAWLKATKGAALRYESAFEQADDTEKTHLKDHLAKHLSELVATGAIKSFEKTSDGFKATVNSKEQFHLDLNKQQLSFMGRDVNENSFKTAFTLLQAIGTHTIDLSKVQSHEQRYVAWKAAQESRLAVQGLSPSEESEFKNRREEPTLQPK